MLHFECPLCYLQSQMLLQFDSNPPNIDDYIITVAQDKKVLDVMYENYVIAFK